MVYKLRCVLRGHELDVRAVVAAAYPEGAVLTGSRDQQCKLWVPEGENNFVDSKTFLGHTKYVSAVCSVAPSDKYPQGLLISGGSDKMILVFDVASAEVVQKLEGHKANVCSLAAGKVGTILSGSWDKTARVWLNGETVLELVGHEAAIWAVLMMPDQGLMLTGSADKTIKMWKAGKCERTFTGHTDCVRGLALLSTSHFLSCANDNTIRRWDVSGECLQIYEGHNNYVYSVVRLNIDGEYFASCGEDRSVRVWNIDGKCEQTIMMPCQSIWSIAALENGDFVTGSSDHMARVFTADSTRQASPDQLKEFEEEVSNQAIPAAANLDLGEINPDQLPGPEALLRPGTKNEQTKLIRNQGKVEAHQWDDANEKWIKIGDVTGAAGEEGSKRKAGKELYKGKEYDIVFNVDIKEGAPPLKLPFNLTDDPYVAANKFLEDNDIDKMFLDQVAKFIIDNTKGMTIGPSSGYSDPFTGGGRYVPGSNDIQMAEPTHGADPFTGAHSYSTNRAPLKTVGQPTSSKYIPETTFLKFVSGKAQPIMGKVTEFNGGVTEELRLSEEDLKLLSDTTTQLLGGNMTLDNNTVDRVLIMAHKLQRWPANVIFPVLDILRLFVCQNEIGNAFFADEHRKAFVDRLLVLARECEPVANGMLVYRLFTNSFTHSKGVHVLWQEREKVLDVRCCSMVYSTDNKNLRIAVASCLVNYCVEWRKRRGTFEEGVHICTVLFNLLQLASNAESLFRLLVAMGTLVADNSDMISFAKSLELETLLQRIITNKETDKVGDVASEILFTFEAS